MESTSESTGIGFEFGSFVFQDAFAKLSKALRWMFWGTVMQLLGFAVVAAPVAAVLAPRAGGAPLVGGPRLRLVLPAGLILLSVGGIVVIVGEQRCLHLQLPLGMTRSLPGHFWLRGAYWFHLGSWLLRLGRNVIGRGPVGLLLLPMQLIGFGLLLLFLRKMADVMARTDLRRLVDAIFLLGGATLLIGVALVADRSLQLQLFKALPRPAAMMLLALPLLSLVAAAMAYIVLLHQLARAAFGFSHFLATTDFSAAEGVEPVNPM